jgi:hypothetical protein
VKTVRPIPIADHLWEALERMASELGSEPEAIVNQALHVLGRMHGFILPGSGSGTGAASPPPLDPLRREAARRVLLAAAELEDGMESERTPASFEPAPLGTTLFIVGEGGEIEKVRADRFVIGRGKHCDLIIDSGKVSREHAVVVREAEGWFIQDLGSANGTWFQRARIDRRRIEDGDEYYICSEKIRCVLR